MFLSLALIFNAGIVTTVIFPYAIDDQCGIVDRQPTVEVSIGQLATDDDLFTVVIQPPDMPVYAAILSMSTPKENSVSDDSSFGMIHTWTQKSYTVQIYSSSATNTALKSSVAIIFLH